ncbi:MAG: outer membrane beta-barrel protein [Bacteroidales bacterium]
MVNKEANIDLLFRNGLKDLEVLPPAQCWGTVLPVIRKRARPVIYLRSAALVAVLLSVSFLAYRWSRELGSIVQSPQLALGEESVKYQNNFGNPASSRFPQAKVSRPGDSGSNDIIGQDDTVSFPDDQKYISPDEDLFGDHMPITVDKGFLLPYDIQALTDYRTGNNSGDVSAALDEFSYQIPKIKVDRWSVMAMASPTYYLNPVSGSDDLSNQLNSSEQSQISYSGGVGFAYKISRKLSIQSGLYYSSVGQQVNGISSFGGFRPYDFTKGGDNFKVLTSNGLISTSNADVFLLDPTGDRVQTRYTRDVFDPTKASLSYISSSLYQNFSYIEMPVILRYKVIDKTFDFNLIGGLSYNLLVNNSVHTMIDGSRYQVGSTELNPFMLSSSLGMGMEYNLSEKFSLNLEPTFRYYLNPFGSVPGVRVHPYSFGIFSGLSFKF